MERADSNAKATTSAEPVQQATPITPKEAPVMTSKESQHSKELEPIIVKAQKRVHTMTPFKIIDNMKKVNVTMSMWDSLALLGQPKILKKAMIEVATPQPTKEATKPVLVNTDQEKEAPSSNSKGNAIQGRNSNPPPFYVSLIIGKPLVHNCMVDSGATSTVMPKKVANQLGLKYEPFQKKVT